MRDGEGEEKKGREWERFLLLLMGGELKASTARERVEAGAGGGGEVVAKGGGGADGGARRGWQGEGVGGGRGGREAEIKGDK